MDDEFFKQEKEKFLIIDPISEVMVAEFLSVGDTGYAGYLLDDSWR